MLAGILNFHSLAGQHLGGRKQRINVAGADGLNHILVLDLQQFVHLLV